MARGVERERALTRRAGTRARHVLAHDAGLDAGIDHRRARGEPRGRRRLDDRLHGTHRNAVTAAGAGREKRQLVRRARRPEVAARRHPLLGARRDLAQQPAERLAEEPAPIARLGGGGGGGVRIHQKLGARLTCHRNARRPSPGRGSAAYSQRLTIRGTSKRMVQSRSRMRWLVTRPSPPSYSAVYHRPGGDDGTARVSTSPPSTKPSSATARKIAPSRRHTERVSSTFAASAQRPPRSLRKPRRPALPGAW